MMMSANGLHFLFKQIRKPAPPPSSWLFSRSTSHTSSSVVTNKRSFDVFFSCQQNKNRPLFVFLERLGSGTTSSLITPCNFGLKSIGPIDRPEGGCVGGKRRKRKEKRLGWSGQQTGYLWHLSCRFCVVLPFCWRWRRRPRASPASSTSAATSLCLNGRGAKLGPMRLLLLDGGQQQLLPKDNPPTHAGASHYRRMR